MKILTVDVGTGTQDIFLYDSALALENGYKLVLPSPTMRVHWRLKEATRQREAVLLTGYLMGGGPSQWAARDHVLAGGALYATPEAARTFNDDLDYVTHELGVQLVSADEAQQLNSSVTRLELKDFDYALIEQTLAAFGVTTTFDVVAVAVFDHGDAPPGYSDRQFRFDYLDAQCKAHNHLAAFAHRAEAVPASMTRLQAVANSARAQGVSGHLMVMDTAPAAVLGTTFDPLVAAQLARGALVANVGNFHCLAFRLSGQGIEGLFEHHTGEVTCDKLDRYLSALADSTLTHRTIFDDMGHGALVYNPTPMPAPRFVAVTGPRRQLLTASRHAPYFAVPFGDMMMAGCFGLLAATAHIYPDLAAPLHHSLAGQTGGAPWDAH